MALLLGTGCKHDWVRTSCVLQLSMRVDEQCKFLCRIKSLSENEAKQFHTRIKEEYRVNMCAPYVRLSHAYWPNTGQEYDDLCTCRILDNLPVAMVRWRATAPGRDTSESNFVKYYDRGFPVGEFVQSEVRAAKTHCNCKMYQLVLCNM